MLHTYAGRYSLIALLVSLIFAGVQMILELSELRLSITWASLAAAFGAKELSLIAMALSFTALAWWAGRQRDRLVIQRRYADALSRVTLNLLHVGDLDQALNEIMPPLTRALDGEDGMLFVTEHHDMTLRASTPNALPATAEAMRLLLTRPAPEVLRDKLLTFKLEDYRPLTDEALARDCRQMFAAFLPDDTESRVGWLAVTTKQAAALTPEQENFLQLAAGQIALLLSRTRQVVELRRRARDLEAIAQVNRTLLAGMDLDELLQTVVSATQVRFGLPFVGIGWVDEDTHELYMRAAAGPLVQQLPLHYRQKLSEGAASIVYRTGQPYLTRDVSEDPHFLSALDTPARSSLMAPLKASGKVVGLMGFESLGRDAFSDEDVAALTTLADLVATAVGNARLVTEAQRERRRVGAILRSTVDVILLIDARGLVQLMNPAAERLAGQSGEEAVGRPIDQVLTQRPLLEVYRRAVAPSRAEAVQTAEVTLDNGVTYLVTITFVRDEDQAFLGRVVAMKDITPLKQLDRYKSQMLQMASHDLRTPLGVATGYVELLGDELQPLTPLRQKILRGLAAALERMETLITELLDVERVESGVDHMRAPVDIRPLVETVVQDLQDAANHKQQTLELDTPLQTPTIQGDPVRLKQVFSNLIDNAIKYTPANGRVWVRVKSEAHEVVIEVQDTGYGIPAAAQAKLFQRFFRVKAPGTENIPGTGLGLSLVKAIVEQHDGRVTVESVERQGSTFRVWLPFSEVK